MALSRTLLYAGHTTASGSTLTSSSVTVNAGELLTAQISMTKFSDAELPTSVTWNSLSLTKLGDHTHQGGVESQWSGVAIYYLKVASTASATCVVTCAGANDEIALTLQSWTGHDTTTPMADFQSSDQDNGSGVSPSLTATGFASGDYILDCLATSDFVSIGANQTSVLSFDTVWDQHHSVQSGADGGAMTWTITNDRGYDYCIGTVKAGATGVTGSASYTLGNLTDSASGTVLVRATASPTLATLTQSATATVLVRATSAPTLATLTQSAAATVLVRATAAQTLDGITSSASATVGSIIHASADQTLDSITQAATATILVQGSASQTLDNITDSALAAVLVRATAAQTLDNLTQTATGTVGAGTVTGSADQTLQDATSSAVATVLVQGTSSITLDSITSLGSMTNSTPVEITSRSDKMGGWHNRGDYRNWQLRFQQHRKRQEEIKTRLDEIEARLTGLAKQAYTAVRKDKTPEARELRQVIAPFTEAEGLPASRSINWESLVARELSGLVRTLDVALTSLEAKRNAEKIDLANQLQSALNEYERLKTEEEERDEEEALSLILYHSV